MIKIDYIINAYRKSDIIKVGLDHLCSQTYRKNIDVTLVNDCSPNTDCNYNDLVEEYKDKINIRVIKTPSNLKAGLARQYGVDNTHNKYIIFQDDDDYLNTDTAIEQYIKAIENTDSSVKSIRSGWEEVDSLGNIIGYRRCSDSNTHMMQVLYRDIIDKYNIRFDKSTSEIFEDIEFGGKYNFILNKYRYNSVDIQDNVYEYVHHSDNSTTDRLTAERADIYTAISSANIYNFAVQFGKDETTENMLYNTLEYSLFAILRCICNHNGVYREDVIKLQKCINQLINDVDDTCIIRNNSIIYKMQYRYNVEMDKLYLAFLDNPDAIINILLKSL